MTNSTNVFLIPVPSGSPSDGGDVTVYVFDIKSTELAHSFLLCSCVYFCLYGPFNCISFHKFSRQLSTFSLFFQSSFFLIGPFNISMKVSFSPVLILCGWLGLKRQQTNLFMEASFSPNIIFCGWQDWKHQLTYYSILDPRWVSTSYFLMWPTRWSDFLIPSVLCFHQC